MEMQLTWAAFKASALGIRSDTPAGTTQLAGLALRMCVALVEFENAGGRIEFVDPPESESHDEH